MKLSEVEIQADGKKATFFYTADDRVDFRELIKLYAGEFRVKVEMRQIGARQEAGKRRRRPGERLAPGKAQAAESKHDQKDAQEDDPGLSGLCSVGTLATVVQHHEGEHDELAHVLVVARGQRHGVAIEARLEKAQRKTVIMIC